MRTHIKNTIAAINAQFKEGRKNLAVKKNPRFIYTEADLGEGLLDAGIAFYEREMNNLRTKRWTNMLRTA